MVKKKNSILLIGLILILVLVIGLSYGYYLLNRVQENNNVVGSKCFNLEFTNEKNAISLDNMYPISDEEGRKLTPYSFTITNTCDMLAGYIVNMEMLEGTTLNSKYLDVMVNNEEIKLLTNYESTNTVITGSTESRVLAKGTLAYNDSIDYTVRFWMDKDVEDTESMNKLFKSKIVISATPSSWNPKAAGYDTLHDAILANEYQTTPEDTISKIEAKGEPDLSQTAPVINWIEKVGESATEETVKLDIDAINSDTQTDELTEADTKLRLYTSYNFDKKTGKYSLSNPIYIDPTIIDFDSDIKYFYIKEYSTYNYSTGKIYTVSRNENMTIYYLTGASKENASIDFNGTTYNGIKYKLNLGSLTQSEVNVDKSDRGLYLSNDNYGTSYYYRGNVTNNNVYFAGYYWQIVRINGDNSIRLIYNGTKKNSTGDEKIIGSSTFNNVPNNPAYVGYMYGDNLGTRENNIKNIKDSSIKTFIDKWYYKNILSKNLGTYLSDSGFCNDRELYSGDGFSNSNHTFFKAYDRYNKNDATFKCENKNDFFTVTDTEVGNGSLLYPVGLITYDELTFAGLNGNGINKFSWSYSSSTYWTMTPSNYSVSYNIAGGFTLESSGHIYQWPGVQTSYGVRPVINLKSDVKITGGIGTANDPFVVDTNN